MTDAPQGHAERFFAVVLPALKRAGYDGYKSQQRLADDTGMSPSTVSRLVRGLKVPDIKYFPALANVIDADPLELAVLAALLPPEFLQSHRTLSETKQSQVWSGPITPEEAAERLGIKDDVGKMMFFGAVEKLTQPQDQANDTGEAPGGTAAQM
ncbi:helix-turn-helix domain-containing protein [Streptomyces sp. NPDC060223]|uniref:helix-turn-helix domain-containing protein n=1 Tax=unclassified Streptomyces TaxID=2593676 RepID=UPI0036457013